MKNGYYPSLPDLPLVSTSRENSTDLWCVNPTEPVDDIVGYTHVVNGVELPNPPSAHLHDRIDYPQIGNLIDSARHCIAIIGPFNPPSVFRCEYQYSGHSGIIQQALDDDAPEPKAKNVHEGSTSYDQYRYLTAIATWLTETQQAFLKSMNINDMMLEDKAPPWDINDFDKVVLAGHPKGLALMMQTWLYSPAVIMNMAVIFTLPTFKNAHKNNKSSAKRY